MTSNIRAKNDPFLGPLLPNDCQLFRFNREREEIRARGRRSGWGEWGSWIDAYLKSSYTENTLDRQAV